MNRILRSCEMIAKTSRLFALSRGYHKGHEKAILDNFLTRLQNQFAVYPKTQVIEDMMSRLLTNEQMEFMTRVPRGPVFVKDMVEKFDGQMDEVEVKDMLDDLYKLGMLVEDNDYYFHFPEIVVGWFEFVWMKDRHGKLPMKELSELMNVYKKEVRDANFGKSIDVPKVMRTVVREEVMPSIDMKIVDYESARKIIDNSTLFGVTDCSCQNLEADLREKEEAEKMHKKNPIRRCLCFGNEDSDFVTNFVKHGLVEEITKEESFEILAMSKEKGYIQNVDNCQHPRFICNCPKEICGLIKIIEEFHELKDTKYEKSLYSGSVAPSRFIAYLDNVENCVACGTCIKMCPGFCYSIEKGKSVVEFDDRLCLGCGVCVDFCKEGVIKMKDRPDDDSLHVALNIPETNLMRGLKSITELGLLHLILFPDDEKLSNRIMIPIFRTFERSFLGKKLLNNDKFRKKLSIKAKAKVQERLKKEIEEAKNM